MSEPDGEYITLTDEEERAIKSLKRLAKRWPQTLMIFASGVSLSIRKVPPGEHPGWQWEVDFIIGIPNDGGDGCDTE